MWGIVFSCIYEKPCSLFFEEALKVSSRWDRRRCEDGHGKWTKCLRVGLGGWDRVGTLNHLLIGCCIINTVSAMKSQTKGFFMSLMMLIHLKWTKSG